MIDPELDELKREFLTEAEDKVREMQTSVDSGRSRESLDRLTYLAHQLKGAGGSYGFGRISTEAAELEKAAERLAGGERPDGLEEKLQQHVVNLRGEIQRRSRELRPVSS
jgi:HPt (histidine-containing phosphotransfer) domain-containing protein